MCFCYLLAVETNQRKFQEMDCRARLRATMTVSYIFQFNNLNSSLIQTIIIIFQALSSNCFHLEFPFCPLLSIPKT